MELFGNRLKTIRCELGLSQEEFAKLLGTSKQVISRYETNQRTPKITVANEYAIKLNVPLGYLLGGDSKEKSADDDVGELLNIIFHDERRAKLAEWIAGLDDRGLDRIEKLLDAVEMLPKD